MKLNIKVPNDFYFHYGKTLIKNRNFESGKKMIEKFIGLAGRTSEMYKPALELLAEAEEAAERAKNTFEANGEEWLLGPGNVNWIEAQTWINNLGGGWHTPTRAQLKSLYESVKSSSLIGSDCVWAEKKIPRRRGASTSRKAAGTRALSASGTTTSGLLQFVSEAKSAFCRFCTRIVYKLISHCDGDNHADPKL